MKLTIKQTPDGPVTLVQHFDPPMASSFAGILSPPEVEQRLKIWRAIDAQQKKAAS